MYMLNFIDRQMLAVLQEPIRLEMGLRDEQLGLLTGTAFAIFYISAIAYVLEAPAGDFLFNEHAPACTDIEDRTSDLAILADFHEIANPIDKVSFSRRLHTLPLGTVLVPS